MTTIIPLFAILVLTLISPPCLSLRDHQIGQRSVLLPVDYGATHRVQHLMQAFGGCYIWTTTQPSILKLTPLANENTTNCQSKVLIEVQKQGQYTSPLYISAIDKDTKQIMKVIVKLSKLSRIQILTKFRLMNLFQVQEFYLIGYDEFGNSFSSLEGLKFDWRIEQSDQKNKVAEAITIRESNIFQETNYRRSLEELGYQTDMLVIKTLNIGEIELSVRLNQYNYESIGTSIKLSVQERFTVQPSSPLYMLTGSRLRLFLFNTKDQKIKLPLSYYQPTVSPSTFDITNDLILSSPQYQSEGKLLIKDIRTQPAYTNQIDVYNLNADNIEIVCKSHVIVGQSEEFKILFFNKRRLLKGSVATKIESDFYINRENSSFVASGKTVGYIRVSYNGLVHEKKVMANLPLKIVLVGEKIVLPVGQNFEVKVLGGSGQYEYEIVDFKNTATISENGVIHSHNVGKALIVIKDSNDNNNKIEVQLIVDNVKLIRSFDQKLQAGLDEQIVTLAIAQPEHQKQFTQCNQLNIRVSDTDFLQNRQDKDTTISTILKIHQNARRNPELNNVLDIFRQGRDFNLNDYRDYLVHDEIAMNDLERLLWIQDNFGICKAVRVKPTMAKDGEAAFEILNQNENTYVSTPFKVKIYKELGIRDYISNRILLTPGTYFVWRSIENNADGSIYYLNNIRVRQGDPISLTCSEAGETREYNIKVVHQISQKLPRPYTREIKVIIQCLHPSSLKFKQNDRVIDNNKLYTVSNSPFQLQLKGFDHLGRQFYNISSLELAWDLDGVTKNDLSKSDNLYRFSFTQQHYNPSITVKTSGSRYHGINFPQIETSLDIIRTREFHILFHDKPVTNFISLIAPNNLQIINIVGGSDNFEVRSSNPELLKVSYPSDNKKVIGLEPLKRGAVQLTVTDLDQYGRPTQEIDIIISGLSKMIIKSNATLVEQGSHFRLSYLLFGENNMLVGQEQIEYLKVVVKHDCGIERGFDNIFKALRRGHCSITASIPSHGISSENSVEIEIFPKFSINIPHVIEEQRNGVKYYTGETRVPLGCNSTIMFLGGPFSVGKLTYQVSPSKYLTIEELNLRTFKLVGTHKGTSEVKFILKDGEHDISIIRIHVTVKEIDQDIKFSPGSSRQIHQKATVKITPELYIDKQRVLDSSCPIVYHWKTDNQNVISIKRWNNEDVKGTETTGLNVTGVKKGVAKIEITAYFNNKKLSAQFVIFQVLEIPEVNLATYINHGKGKPISLLLPPNSGYSLNSSCSVDIVSPCQNLMKIDGTQITTLNDKGASILKLKSHSTRQNSVTYMSVQIQKIYSIFIENPLGKINIQLDTEVRIPFYVQDYFGRLFPNNLKNIDYDLRISNPKVISAEVSEDLEEIVIRGYSGGSSELYISIRGHPEIYDVVLIETKMLLLPASPVVVHVGGHVEFRSLGGLDGEWRCQDKGVMQIDKKTGKALALSEGYTQVSFSHGVEYKCRVIVFMATRVSEKTINQKLTNYQSSEQQINLQIFGQIQSNIIEITNFQNMQNLTQNNLIVNCYSDYPDWFDVQCVIQTNEAKKTQSVTAYIRAAKPYPENQQMPSYLSFIFKLQSGSTGQTFLQRKITLPYYFQYKIAKPDYTIYLDPKTQSKTITIQTNHKLNIISDQQKSNWISSEFLPDKSIQVLRIDMRSFNESSQAIINVFSSKTNQKEKIYAYYGGKGWFSGFGAVGVWIGRLGIITWLLGLTVFVLVALCIYSYTKREYVYYGKDD